MAKTAPSTPAIPSCRPLVAVLASVLGVAPMMGAAGCNVPITYQLLGDGDASGSGDESDDDDTPGGSGVSGVSGGTGGTSGATSTGGTVSTTGFPDPTAGTVGTSGATTGA